MRSRENLEQKQPGNRRQRTLGALPLSYTGTIPVTGFEPATSRLTGEVTLVFTTGRIHVYSLSRSLHFRHACAEQVAHSNSAMILSGRRARIPRRVQGRLPVAPRVGRSHTSALAAAWFAPRRRVSFRGQLSAPTMQILAREQVDTAGLAPRGFEPHSPPKRSCSPEKSP